MDLYYDMTRQMRVDATGARVTGRPLLSYKEQPVWELHLVDGENLPLDLSGLPSWRAAVDSDLLSSTEVMCRTLNDKIDKSSLAEGIVRVQLDANTTTFLAAVDGKENLPAYFELWGYDADGGKQIYLRIGITASSVVDPEGGEPPEAPDSGLVEKTELEALVSRPLIYEYSVDGEEAHSTFVIHVDKYQRVRHGENGEPSAWQPIPYGVDGRVVEPGMVAPLAERPENPEDGFCFCDSDSGDLYWYLSGAWTNPVHITTLQGPAGKDGKDGAPGADGKDGAPGAKGDEGKQGEPGPQGPAGQGLWIDKTDILARRHLYDAAEANFIFLATDLLMDETDGRHYQCWYQKKSNDLGDWSSGVRLYQGIQGEQGVQGEPGPQGPQGENASVTPDYLFTEAEIYGGSLVISGVRPIAQVELNLEDGAGKVIPIAGEPGTPDCCAIRTCYEENHTVIYFGTIDTSSGGRIRFAQGIGGKTQYQEYLDQGGLLSYNEWIEAVKNTMPEAPNDGLFYCRKNSQWVAVAVQELGGISISGTGTYRETLSVGEAFSLTFDAVASSGADVAIELTSGTLPDGLSLNGKTISGTPSAEGSASLTFTASADGASMAIQVELTIRKTADMYFGHVASTAEIYKIADITAEMLSAETVHHMPAKSLDKTSLGDASPGDMDFVLLPKEENLKALKFDGISGWLAFEENKGGVSGSGANGTEISLNGVSYLAYGEIRLVSGETFIKVEEI